MSAAESPMEFHVITLFPELFAAANWPGMVGRALKAGLVKIEAHSLREHGLGGYRQVDDTPYGGGSGMVMRPEPIAAAIDAVNAERPGLWRILMTPQGEVFDNSMARDLAKRAPGLMIVAGRYEGIDERVRSLVDQEISIGDYVLSGGEPAALVIVDATVRLLEGAMSDMDSARTDSHWSGGLSAPSYTRPATYRGFAVPDVLMSGDHKRIDAWRLAEGERLTRERLASDAAPGTRHADEPPHP